MHDRLRAWHVLLAGPVVGFLVGLAMILVSPLAQAAGVGSTEAVALAVHGSVVVVVAVFAAVAAIVPLVLLAFDRLPRLGVVLSAVLSVGFGLAPPEPHPATWAAVGVFALAAVLGWREAEQVADADAGPAAREGVDGGSQEDGDVEEGPVTRG